MDLGRGMRLTDTRQAMAQTHPLLQRGYRFRLLAILLAANTLNFVDRAVLSAIVEPMRVELGMSDSQIGLLQGLAFAVTYAVMGIPIGRLAERHNRLRIVAVCVIFFSVATGLCGLATSFFQLFVLRILVGAGEGGFMAPASSVVADHYPANRRASALAIVLLGMPLGFFFGSLLGGMIAQTYGWRMAFFAMAIPGIVVVGLLLFALREPPRGLADGGHENLKIATPPPLMAVLRHLFSKPAFRHLIAGAVLCTCGANAIGQFQFVFLLRVYGLELGQAGIVSGTISLLSLGLGMLIGGGGTDWLERLDRRWYLWIPTGGAVIGAGFFALGFYVDQLAVAVPLIIFGGICLFLYFAPAYALVQNIAGMTMRASAVAIFGVFTGLLGAGLGPTIAGIASDQIARSVFTGNDYTAQCRAGPAPEPGGLMDVACQAAAAAGLRGTLIAMTLLFLWAAVHFLLASRTIDAALGTREPGSPIAA